MTANPNVYHTTLVAQYVRKAGTNAGKKRTLHYLQKKKGKFLAPTHIHLAIGSRVKITENLGVEIGKY